MDKGCVIDAGPLLPLLQSARGRACCEYRVEKQLGDELNSSVKGKNYVRSACLEESRLRRNVEINAGVKISHRDRISAHGKIR